MPVPSASQVSKVTREANPSPDQGAAGTSELAETNEPVDKAAKPEPFKAALAAAQPLPCTGRLSRVEAAALERRQRAAALGTPMKQFAPRNASAEVRLPVKRGPEASLDAESNASSASSGLADQRTESTASTASCGPADQHAESIASTASSGPADQHGESASTASDPAEQHGESAASGESLASAGTEQPDDESAKDLGEAQDCVRRKSSDESVASTRSCDEVSPTASDATADCSLAATDATANCSPTATDAMADGSPTASDATANGSPTATTAEGSPTATTADGSPTASDATAETPTSRAATSLATAVDRTGEIPPQGANPRGSGPEPSLVRMVDVDTGKQRLVVTGPDGKVTAFGENTVDSMLQSPEDSVEKWVSGLTDLELRGLVHTVGAQLLSSSRLYQMQQAQLETLADKADRSFFGLPDGATQRDLDNAYRRLARQMHPDKNGGTEEAKNRFQHMKERYEALKARLKGPTAAGQAAPGGAQGDRELEYDPSDRQSLRRALDTMLSRLRPIRSGLDEIRRKFSRTQAEVAAIAS